MNPDTPASAARCGKLIFLWCCKAAGLFIVSKWLTRRRLRILCYHGFALDDENGFRPNLFMRSKLFRKRMDYLLRKGFPVLRLEDALPLVTKGELPACAVSITIDDGFYSVLKIAAPLLKERNFPATLYVTSYYMKKQVPIYRLLIDYILWKAPDGRALDLSKIGPDALAEAGSVTLDKTERERVCELIRIYGEEKCDEPGRQAIARALAQSLDLDYDRIVESRILSLVTSAETEALEDSKVSIHLHTHRHDFPTDPAKATKELQDNREALEEKLAPKPYHFCYPSGDWSPEHWPVLQSLRVESATTCDSRLVDGATHRYALPRILDDVRVSQIEFEAELCGFIDLVRDLKDALAKRQGANPTPQGASHRKEA